MLHRMLRLHHRPGYAPPRCRVDSFARLDRDNRRIMRGLTDAKAETDPGGVSAVVVMS